MKRSQLAKGLFIALCAVMLSGCQTSSPGKDRRPETDSATSQSQQSPDTGSDIDSLAASALAHGDVVEFTESGCIISPVQDDGDTSIIAAPEHMDETEKITIQYQEGCEVQIAVSDASTGETAFRPASLSDIKKQTSILVFGENQDSGTIKATKIVIWQTANATGTGSGD